jgi:hypothetical protein
MNLLSPHESIFYFELKMKIRNSLAVVILFMDKLAIIMQERNLINASLDFVNISAASYTPDSYSLP